MKSIKLPHSLKRIGEDTFCSCIGIKDILLPDGLSEIGYEAFDGCKNLTSIKIPTSVTSMYYPFWGCDSLTDVEIDEALLRENIYAFKDTPFYKRIASGLNYCAYCGGDLTGIITKKCKRCGKQK